MLLAFPLFPWTCVSFLFIHFDLDAKCVLRVCVCARMRTPAWGHACVPTLVLPVLSSPWGGPSALSLSS